MQIYEVLVEPRNNGNSNNDNRGNVVRKLHYARNDPDQARREGAKHGIVKGVYKVDKDNLSPKSGNIKLNNPPPEEINMGNPFQNALAMDELIWKKVQVRRFNMQKEKSKLDQNTLDK